MGYQKPVPPSQIVEVLVAIALILWRIWEVPIATLWRDWIVLLVAYAMFLSFAPAGRVRTSVTVAAMAGCMLLYAWGQGPHLLALLRSLT